MGAGAVNSVKHFCSKNTKVFSLNNDMVSDFSEKILKITTELSMAKVLSMNVEALEVVKQQSEVLKQDFTDLINKCDV